LLERGEIEEAMLEMWDSTWQKRANWEIHEKMAG
jgi:hypothetical protein